jgi:hypothetical protein
MQTYSGTVLVTGASAGVGGWGAPPPLPPPPLPHAWSLPPAGGTGWKHSPESSSPPTARGATYWRWTSATPDRSPACWTG